MEDIHKVREGGNGGGSTLEQNFQESFRQARTSMCRITRNIYRFFFLNGAAKIFFFWCLPLPISWYCIGVFMIFSRLENDMLSYIFGRHLCAGCHRCCSLHYVLSCYSVRYRPSRFPATLTRVPLKLDIFIFLL